jgi:hypothetical protein
MDAGDDELLLMLVQADVCLRCSHLALQLLLDYACQVRCRQAATATMLTNAGLCWPMCRQHGSHETAAKHSTYGVAQRQHMHMRQSVPKHTCRSEI